MTDRTQHSSHSDKSLCHSEMIKKSILIKDGNPARHRLKTTTTDHPDESGAYRKIIFGERNPKKPHKIFLMVGETGTGKTTLINTVINYTCGVKREDKIWIEITDDQSKVTSVQSQTSIITVYGVYIQEASLDLTIIDTPGYGDTRGISHDKVIAESLLHVCRSNNKVNKIDAVCLVIKADQNRLSDRQKYIFDAVQALFGKDVSENIVLLFTHSDGAPPKNALTAVKEAKVKCAVDEKNQPIYFLFNSRQSERLDGEHQKIQDHSWDLSYRGMKGVFNFLDLIIPKTLEMTEQVLQKRKQLEIKISDLQSHVLMIEHKQDELKKAQDDLEKHKRENKNFEFTVEVPNKVKVDIDPAVAKQAMCCSVCEENCHYPGCWWVKDLSWCSVMRNNHCTVCTNKCHHSKHIKESKIYVTKTEKMINEDLKKKYEDKIKESLSVIYKLKEELQELEKEKIKLVMSAFHYVESLEIIALNTNSLFILQHIDALIEKMKEIKEPEKAEALENIKKRAGENQVPHTTQPVCFI